MEKHRNKEKQYKVRRLDLRLTEDDYAKVRALADRLTFGNVTKLFMAAVTDRPIPVVEVNEADRRVVDYVRKIMDVYRNIGINYNQVVKRINTIRAAGDIVREVAALTEKTEKLIQLTEALNRLFMELNNGNKNQ